MTHAKLHILLNTQNDVKSANWQLYQNTYLVQVRNGTGQDFLDPT